MEWPGSDRATRVYCLVHKVPICGECICFPEHQLCVITYCCCSARMTEDSTAELDDFCLTSNCLSAPLTKTICGPARETHPLTDLWTVVPQLRTPAAIKWKKPPPPPPPD
ncbi:hypothetical protein E2562_007809 [Oryza meyeriana var. granulata]|uniref:ZFPL1-like B-box zinc-binding domain-containing protein n=1 Tax=Oryza meyeriana var. granulata TaxID=110450 RepID=A0A6G1F583_9ORYZ|nr:hypothetical protein E2562_007809 [Oryza meyeriana var. granulata]